MKYKIEGLDCANCALKIENKIKKLESVETANINFALKSLKIKLKENQNEEKVIKEIKKIIKENEPGAYIVDKTINKENSYEMLKIIISGILFILGLNLNNNFKFIIFLISYIIVGYEIIIKAIKNILKGQIFDENFLMTLATLGAFFIKEYSEAVAVMLFYKIGEYIEEKAVNHSRKSIQDLMNIKPEIVNIKINDKIIKEDPEKVKIGDIIIVKPGEKIPLDGIVLEGDSYLDTKALTGESVLKKVKINDDVLSGTINTNGLLTIKVTKTYENSTVSKILDLVENSTNKKAETEKFITKFAKIYTPIVIIVALMIAIFLPLITNITYNESIYKALVCLVISCPCALVLSIPLSYFSGIGCASKKGILIKGTNYLEALNNLDTICFDKTGTLTLGVFKVTDIVPNENIKKEELLKYASYAEYYSNHPIAKSIINEYNKKIDKNKIKNYKELAGYGVKATIDNKEILIGNYKLLEKEKINYKNKLNAIHIACDKNYLGYMIVSDIIKNKTKEYLETLKKLGLKIVMLTGDSKEVAKEVAKNLNIKDYKAELLPHEKVKYLEKIKTNKMIGFVGDGINDAPALAISDIGFSMGGIGSDSAIEASDIVLMIDNINLIATSLKIAKKTKKIVLENITLALLIKIIAFILGIIGIATIYWSVIADVGVTIIAVLNSIRCLKIKE